MSGPQIQQNQAVKPGFDVEGTAAEPPKKGLSNPVVHQQIAADTSSNPPAKLPPVVAFFAACYQAQLRVLASNPDPEAQAAAVRRACASVAAFYGPTMTGWVDWLPATLSGQADACPGRVRRLSVPEVRAVAVATARALQ